jgi:hypothetical protein
MDKEDNIALTSTSSDTGEIPPSCFRDPRRFGGFLLTWMGADLEITNTPRFGRDSSLGHSSVSRVRAAKSPQGDGARGCGR